MAAPALAAGRRPRMIPKKPAPDLIRGGNRCPAFAKPALAGEGRSEKIMCKNYLPVLTRVHSRLSSRCVLASWALIV